MLNPLRAETRPAPHRDQLVEYLGQLPQRAGTGQDVLRDEIAGWLLLGAGTHTRDGPPVLEAEIDLLLLLPADLREPPQALRLLAGEHRSGRPAASRQRP